MPDVDGRPTEGEQWYALNNNSNAPIGTGQAEPSVVWWAIKGIVALSIALPLLGFLAYLPFMLLDLIF